MMMSETEEKLSDVLSANYMLASLTIRAWSAKVTDKGATSELLASKGATSNAATVIKSLLAGNDKELKDCIAAYSRIRTWFYANSLPWTTADGQQRGDRLVGTTQAMKFLRDFANLKTEAEKSRAHFLAAYQAATANASGSLGSLYNVTEYPTVQEITYRFGAVLDIVPMPAVNDFDRISIPGAMAQGLKNKYESRAARQVEVAMTDVQVRLLEELERMALQLGKVATGEKARLFKSLVGNMRTIADLAKSMAPVAPELGSLAKRVEEELLVHEVSAYRDNAALSRVVAGKASAIADELKACLSPASAQTQAESSNESVAEEVTVGNVTAAAVEQADVSPSISHEIADFDEDAVYDI